LTRLKGEPASGGTHQWTPAARTRVMRRADADAASVIQTIRLRRAGDGFGPLETVDE
jgi:hypothetical protein